VILDRIDANRSFLDRSFEITGAAQIRIGAKRRRRSLPPANRQWRFHDAHGSLRPPNALQRLIDTARVRRSNSSTASLPTSLPIEPKRVSTFMMFHHFALIFFTACETLARALSSVQSIAVAISRNRGGEITQMQRLALSCGRSEINSRT